MWVWVGLLVVLSACVRYALARRIVAPWIMVDELIYSELAKSFAGTGHFLLRGASTGAYGFVYPALLSPAWALFHAVPQAYAAAKAINSVVVSLAAIPAYLLARRVCSRPYAFAAAVLAMSVPTLLFSGMLMTENVFYPAFLLAALAMVVWLERPDLTRTLLLVGAFLLAYLTRAQAVAFLPAMATAPFLVSGRARTARVPLVLHRRRLGGAARRRRPGRARLVDLRRLRRVRGRRPRRVHGGRRLPLVGLPLGGTDPVARRRAVRRARRPDRDDARPSAQRAGVPRRHAHALVLARARGRRLRVRAVAARRGAEHVLRRAAVPDRADALGRAVVPAAARDRVAGRRRGGRARHRAAVREADRPAGRVRHDRAAAALVDRAVVRRNPERALGRARRVGRRVPALPVRPGAVRARRCRCSSSSTSGSRRSRSRPSTGSPRSSTCSRGSPSRTRDWIDRAVGRNARRLDDLVGQHRPVLDLGERVLQPEPEALLLHERAAPRRPAGDSRSRSTARPA